MKGEVYYRAADRSISELRASGGFRGKADGSRDIVDYLRQGGDSAWVPLASERDQVAEMDKKYLYEVKSDGLLGTSDSDVEFRAAVAYLNTAGKFGAIIFKSGWRC